MKEKELKQNQDMPELNKLQEDKVKTSVTSLKDKVKNTLETLKDLATLELMLPAHIRMRKRLESVKKMGSAQHIKVDGHWKTIPPEIHIRDLEGRKINNNECEVRFKVFAADKNGNKKLFEHKGEIVKDNGDKVIKTISAEYRIAYEVVERIVYRKPITREIIRVGDNQ